MLVVDDWIAFNADPQLAVMIKYVHKGYKGVYRRGTQECTWGTKRKDICSVNRAVVQCDCRPRRHVHVYREKPIITTVLYVTFKYIHGWGEWTLGDNAHTIAF